MIFEEKKIILKNGQTAILKSPCVEDAEKMLNYIKKACGETEFLLRYPEEWDISIEKEEAWVKRLLAAPDTLDIACYIDGEVAGNCEITFRGGMKPLIEPQSPSQFSGNFGILALGLQCLKNLLLQRKDGELRLWN